MIYKYNKYDSINSFINMFSSKNICNEYTILNKCNGFDFEKNKYTDNCFACLFCIFSNTLYKEFNRYWNDDLISKYADTMFNGVPVTPPSAKNIINCKYKSIEYVTSIDETSNIQPCIAGILQNIGSTECRIGLEIPVFNDNYNRNGRLDICVINNNKKMLILETKTSLDDALKDERFIEQQKKYTDEINKYSDDYLYLTAFGGKETDLFPIDSIYCTGKIGNKTLRFYNFVKESNIHFISANAIWGICCNYLKYGKQYSWDIFIDNIFKDKNCVGLLSSGKIIYKDSKYYIEKIKRD